MKSFAFSGFVVALLAGSALLSAQEPPQLPAPQKEHEWLGQLVGEWETTAEATLGPDQPVIKCEGTETIRSLGGFWTVSDTRSTPMGMPMSGVMTLGYDPGKHKYVGTWVDSMTSHLWTYEGTLDAGGKILTLETEGPSFTTPGKTAKYREVIELKSKDYRVFTSSALGDDGKWVTFMTSHARRKK